MKREMENLNIYKECTSKYHILCEELKKYSAKQLSELQETQSFLRSTFYKLQKLDPQNSCLQFMVGNVKILTSKIISYFGESSDKFEDWSQEKKRKLFQLDYLLKRHIQQLGHECVLNFGVSSVSSLRDLFGRKFWVERFGKETFIEKSRFYGELRNVFGETVELNLALLDYYLDFTLDGHISVYEFDTFLQFFGPFNKCIDNVIANHNQGVLVGHITALDAGHLLAGKDKGSFVMRFSKSRNDCLAISFVSQSNDVKHVLLGCQKSTFQLTNSKSQYNSLLEFLAAHRDILTTPVAIPNQLAQGISLGEKMLSENKPKRCQKKNSPKKTEAGGMECVVCMENVRDAVMECRHLVACFSCCKKINCCPVCRAPNHNPIQIFVC